MGNIKLQIIRFNLNAMSVSNLQVAFFYDVHMGHHFINQNVFLNLFFLAFFYTHILSMSSKTSRASYIFIGQHLFFFSMLVVVSIDSFYGGDGTAFSYWCS